MEFLNLQPTDETRNFDLNTVLRGRRYIRCVQQSRNLRAPVESLAIAGREAIQIARNLRANGPAESYHLDYVDQEDRRWRVDVDPQTVKATQVT